MSDAIHVRSLGSCDTAAIDVMECGSGMALVHSTL